jgi:aryl-alcohol dehydrogenase-like predicted oxidoreductase
MRMRPLGRTGIQVSPYCLGTMVFGPFGNPDHDDAIRIIHRALDAGINFVDTADRYSQGESEEIVGKALKGRRDDVVLATKVNGPMSEDPNHQGNSRRWIIAEAEHSLRRLQTDYIDLYQTHWDDPTTPQQETLQGYAKLIQQGKVRAIGASNLSAARLREALAISHRDGLPAYQTFQPNYNLYDRADYETELEPLCQQEALGVINYFSLASGFLTGKYRSEADLANAARGQFVKKYVNDRGFRILSALDEVARQRNVKPGQVAIAWLIARPSITAPIASATKVDQLRELLEATELSLDKNSIERLNQASA